uniref:Zn-dependent peptidase ImmA, M78 family n=1 Tax=Candidatus Kentrum sp. TC TaxID=2126339 RepID=A0A450Z9S5_9GAMM|nr:MAG: Zn-dependent peptidase ImmA, M78 family [Candidatus Kentron sp. TC]VFK59488.1 MAG: Zn-dependent peptidase ImmA, M78 family [Candidatus Kentron sp. TC]
MNQITKYHGLPANRFLEKLREDRLFQITAPIDLDEIVEILDIKINDHIDFDNMGIIGSISVKSGQPIIWLNPMENRYMPRKRFTTSHEIGHFILHIDPAEGVSEFIDTKKTLYRRDSYWDIKEYEANNFAASLLMPIPLINEHGANIISSFSKRYSDKMPIDMFIEEMASRFEVSDPAMRYRLKNLGAIK